MSMAIIVHGGAGTITSDRAEIVQAGCRDAALIGWRILENGGSALDAVEAAVRALEDNPNYNAGKGACLTADGRIELDAGIMNGELLTERQYKRWKEAQSAGVETEEEPRYHRREVNRGSPREERHGTVGAVAVDTSGILAAATSTGGIFNQYPGRVGDTPLVGCGFYADENGAVSCTGEGEDFARLLMAKRTADFVASGVSARDAAEAAIALLGARTGGTGGLIVVDRPGNVGFAWNSENMAHAYMTEGLDEPISGV